MMVSTQIYRDWNDLRNNTKFNEKIFTFQIKE